MLNIGPTSLLINEFDNYDQTRLSKPVYLGCVKHQTETRGKRSVRYYWYDAHDKLSLRYRDFFKPDHRPCGVRGYKARDILREAFEIQAEINQAMGLRSIEFSKT